MVKRLLAGLVVALALLVGACGGSSEAPEAPAPATSSSNAISEADAIARAEAAVIDEGLSLEGLSVKPANLFGEWQVSFEPTTSESLRGGFLVVLDAASGELIELVEYQ